MGRIAAGFLVGVLALPVSAAPPNGMARIAGGVVTVGGYEKDLAAWGRREVYLAPYWLDRDAGPVVDAAACRARKGRLPTVAELEHALREGKVNAGAGAERTATIATPADAEELAAVEGVGFFEALLDGPTRIVLHMPGEKSEAVTVARCVISDGAAAARPAKKLSIATTPRRGRGENWAPVEMFFGVGDKLSAPRKLDLGAPLFVVRRDGAWTLVAQFAESDPIGWVPSANLR